MTLSADDLLEEMLESGVPVEAALRVAPTLVSLVNDPRGLATALAEDCPQLAERIGLAQRQ